MQVSDEGFQAESGRSCLFNKNSITMHGNLNVKW